LDHSFKNQWINIPSISKQLMADPLFRNQGQKLAGGVPDPAPTVGSKWRCRKTKEKIYWEKVMLYILSIIEKGRERVLRQLNVMQL
jgi:hypothetical protein